MGNDCFKGGISGITVNGGAKVEKQNFEWKVENPRIVFENLNLYRGQGFVIQAGERLGCPSRWEFKIGRNVKGDRVCFYIKPIRQNPNVFATFKIRILGTWSWLFGSWPYWLDAKDISVVSKLSNGTLKYHPAGHGVWCDNKEIVTSQGYVVFQVKFKLFALKPGTGLLKSREDELDTVAATTIRSTQRLKKDFATMLENGSPFSDFILISKDSVEFQVHKAVLSGRSPVFEAMFRSNMQEQQTGKVQLEDISSTTLKSLLHYMYTGSLLPNRSNLGEIDDDELKYAADKYMLRELSEILKRTSTIAFYMSH